MKDICVVTGGASGIGKAIAQMLPKDVLIILADRSSERLADVSSSLEKEGHAVATFLFDVSRREDVRTLAAFASNSGYVLPRFLMPSRRIYRLVLKDEEKFFRAMYRRTWLVPAEKWNRHVAYLVSKNFARWYSQQSSFQYMKIKGIRVFSISPGFVKTPMTEAEKGFLSENLLTFTALGRGAEPEELAALAIHLSDDSCSYLFGTDIRADGGCVDNGYRMMTCFRPYRRRHPNDRW